MPELSREEQLAYAEQLEKEASGGGGFIGRANLSVGYKVFAAGFSNEDTFFPIADMSQPGAKQQALSKAKVFVAEQSLLDSRGRAVRPQLSYAFHVYLASVKSEVNWNVDQWFVYPMWTDAIKERKDGQPTGNPGPVHTAIFEDPGVPFGDFWGRFIWAADPSGRTRLNQNDEEVAELISYPVEIYETEAEADEAAEGMGRSESGGVQIVTAPGWLAADIARITGVVKEMEGAPQASIVAALAEQLGVDSDEAAKFLGDDVEAKVLMLAGAYGTQYAKAIGDILGA